MKKGLFIGINDYSGIPLSCCINDVEEMSNILSRNYDNKINFSIKKLLNEDATRRNIRSEIKQLFSGDAECALLYFSGHGFDDPNDGVIVSYDFEQDDCGIKMSEILDYANESKCKNKIVILDCCYSGKFGSSSVMGDITKLKDGVVIFTACSKNEPSYEVNGHGMFTNLLIEALKGGASDLLGRTTPGSLYSYIDQSLGAWDQRPYFKANVSSFISIRDNEPRIHLNDLHAITSLFSDRDSLHRLNPSYEKTNYEGTEYKAIEPYATKENVAKFGVLQRFNRLGLVLPIGEADMYFAAMHNKECGLTPLGKHYWNLVKGGLI